MFKYGAHYKLGDAEKKICSRSSIFVSSSEITYSTISLWAVLTTCASDNRSLNMYGY